MPPTLQQHSSNHHYPATKQTIASAFELSSANAALRGAQQSPNNPNNLRILAQNAQCALLIRATMRKSIVAQRIQSQHRFHERPSAAASKRSQQKTKNASQGTEKSFKIRCAHRKCRRCSILCKHRSTMPPPNIAGFSSSLCSRPSPPSFTT